LEVAGNNFPLQLNFKATPFSGLRLIKTDLPASSFFILTNTKTMFPKILAFLFLAAYTLRADEMLPILTAKGEVYSNVTVTTVTATDVYFTYTNGLGNAKLKDLSPELQKHFHYDATKSAAAEKQQAENTAKYHQYLLTVKPPPPKVEARDPAADGEDFIAPQLHAASIRGRIPPPLAVEHWITPKPDMTGKFVLIDYWATWCGPCRRSIPELNAFSAKFKDQLVVIGLSDETGAAVRKMTDPHIEYAVAVDTQARMMKALAITGIPHCILVDPQGIVRYEGMPGYLDESKLEHFLAKYK
jgi:cytochrome c biogenesis protein CcmG/thiol:disulfide interchange protein DsbE